jgi:catechol 2,3-dioxygenase-like lactoylglutathione lyase family enzyme
MPDQLVDGLDLVYYWVSDLGRAVEFYRDVLGLDLVRQDGLSWAQFDAGGRRFALHRAAEGQPYHGGSATAVFRVRDLDAAKAALAARGIPVERDGDVEGFARFCSIRDPEGNVVELIEYDTASAPGEEARQEGHS